MRSGIGLNKFADFKAAAALNEDLTLTVRQGKHPQHIRGRTDSRRGPWAAGRRYLDRVE